MEESKKLDQNTDADDKDDDDPIDSETNDKTIEVSIGDRIITARGYYGIVRFKGSVHFDERDVIGISQNDVLNILQGTSGTVQTATASLRT